MEKFTQTDRVEEEMEEKSKRANKTPDPIKDQQDIQQKIIRFFNNENIKARENDPNSNTDSDLELWVFNDEMSSKLKKLFRENNANNLNPEEYSLALSYLINEMDSSGYQREIIDPGERRSVEVKTRQAKELFIESCNKVCPDVDKKSLRNPRFILHDLKKTRATNLDDVNFDIDEVAEFFKKGKAELNIKKLKEMAEKINLILHDIERGNIRFVHVFEVEKEGSDKEYVEEYKRKKAIENENIYELLLVRDSIYEKLYGNKDISPEDAKKMDEAREKIETN